MDTKRIEVCTGKSCTEHFSSYILKRLQSDMELDGSESIATLETCCCRWRCREAPVVVFDEEVHIRQNPVKSAEILKKKLNEWRQSSSS